MGRPERRRTDHYGRPVLPGRHRPAFHRRLAELIPAQKLDPVALSGLGHGTLDLRRILFALFLRHLHQQLRVGQGCAESVEKARRQNQIRQVLRQRLELGQRQLQSPRHQYVHVQGRLPLPARDYASILAAVEALHEGRPERGDADRIGQQPLLFHRSQGYFARGGIVDHL